MSFIYIPFIPAWSGCRVGVPGGPTVSTRIFLFHFLPHTILDILDVRCGKLHKCGDGYRWYHITTMAQDFHVWLFDKSPKLSHSKHNVMCFLMCELHGKGMLIFATAQVIKLRHKRPLWSKYNRIWDKSSSIWSVLFHCLFVSRAGDLDHPTSSMS